MIDDEQWMRLHMYLLVGLSLGFTASTRIPEGGREQEGRIDGLDAVCVKHLFGDHLG